LAVALAARGETVDAERVRPGREARSRRAGPAEPVREHEPRERCRPDRVREEGEPAQDDPRPEEAGRHREQQGLERAALDEAVVEGLEHELNENGYRSHRLLA